MSELAPAAGAARSPAATATIVASAGARPGPAPSRSAVLEHTLRGRTLATWLRRLAAGAVGLVVVAGVLVLAARGVTTLPGVPAFLQRYPGSYEPAVATEPGFSLWVRSAHFLNFFLMILIIRSGLLVRHQQRPPAFVTPKRAGAKKVSIYSWMHTSLDVLWLLNGAIFVVLILVSGHWARIVPTSWEALPNAASAALQYATLEWPVEDGWIRYNALQQLMYFLVIFVAAPLAALTGVRMSHWWPVKSVGLNRAYPIEVARAVHYPTMLFFVLFIAVHVTLVFATGARSNLNHMYSGTTGSSWAGFGWFVLGLAVVAAAVVAARPVVVTPIANLFGKVTKR